MKVEPYGLFGRKSRQTEVTAYTWNVNGQDIAEWVRLHRRPDDPAVDPEYTVWLAGNRDDVTASAQT